MYYTPTRKKFLEIPYHFKWVPNGEMIDKLMSYHIGLFVTTCGTYHIKLVYLDDSQINDVFYIDYGGWNYRDIEELMNARINDFIVDNRLSNSKDKYISEAYMEY